MKKIVILLLASAVAQSAWATAAPTNTDSTARSGKVSYYFTFGMGALIGCEQCKTNGTYTSFSVSTVHGVRIGRATFGAGIGFDSYEKWKTLPLFGSASWDLFGKKNKVFVQLNYGYSPAWIAKNLEDYGYKGSQGGKMINPLLGYRINAGSTKVLFSLGYKFQRVFSRYEYPMYYPYPTYSSFAPLPAESTEAQVDIRRFVVGMAIGWK